MSVPNSSVEPTIFNAECLLAILDIEIEDATECQVNMMTSMATDLWMAGYRAAQEDARR